ncbi:MAG: transcriptional regulator [Cyclobacteriaceae bacterium]
MEIYRLKKDIKVFCLKAKSFPEGIKDVFEKLHTIAPISGKRTYYGVSLPEGGKIKYSASANELYDGELSQHEMEPFQMKKGNYLLIEIKDFMKNVSLIEKAFRQLTKEKRIDPNGACIEWYVDNITCRCMVKMKGHED